ncbi:hypothetical protein TRFO_13788 [Tritrichomonas foetus]|uniref:Uncharacterized protein n=1 Tax=Tritrichomonas foetus TaxID=1144522 RepID=A0A1J4L1F3_9EUKA|nr:hypothetical protein TRFO_13788 [Tritrichomonas foetus]|eukprot:OHT15790.1 hypothetical protein TRFO_13788 [Tritrichomonas foetus]
MIHGGVRAISYNDIHPLQVLPNLELKKVNLYVEDTNSIIIDQHYQNAFSILYADDIFFRFRNPSDKVIPFEYIYLTGKILNPNLADLDWSRVKKIDLYSSFYNQNLDLFRNISDITIHWDTYEQDFENALNQIKDGDKSKIYIDFTDLGVNVHTNVTKFKALTLFNTQRYRQVYLNLKNAMKIDNPISFSNLAIDYHISFTQSEWTLRIGNIASQKVEFSDVNNLKVIFQEPLVNQFKVNLTNLRTLTFEYEGNQAGLTKSFSFGYVHSSSNIIIKYLANSHNFTETVIDYLDIKSSSTISAQNKNRGPMTFKVGILDVQMNSNSYTIPSNMEVTGTINSMMYDGTLKIPDQQYIPNLNIISGNAEKRPKIVFSGDRVSVNKITLTIGKLSSCDYNWEIYRRVFKERFANNSYYGKLRNSHILTCSGGPVIPWKSFTPSSEFEYCDKQFATVNLFEVKLTTEEARVFWDSKSELDEYTCLAYEFNLTNIDKSMTTNYYVDTITEDIFS